MTKKDKVRFRYCHENMLTSNVNCLEEIGHHVEAHGIRHMLLVNDCGIGQLKKIRHKSRMIYCSMFHHEYQVTGP